MDRREFLLIEPMNAVMAGRNSFGSFVTFYVRL